MQWCRYESITLVLEYVKENGNSCVMWIDFSDDTQSAEKTPMCEPSSELDNIMQQLNIDDHNNTYIIQKEPSVDCSPEFCMDNQPSLHILNKTFNVDNVDPKSPSKLEEDIRNGNCPEKLSTNTRRRSSSIFIETLRKLVCLDDRYEKHGDT